MQAQDSPLLAAGTVVGRRYQVVRALAQGGMGAIYEAHDTRLGNRRCALKVLLDAGMPAVLPPTTHYAFPAGK